MLVIEWTAKKFFLRSYTYPYFPLTNTVIAVSNRSRSLANYIPNTLVITVISTRISRKKKEYPVHW